VGGVGVEFLTIGGGVGGVGVDFLVGGGVGIDFLLGNEEDEDEGEVQVDTCWVVDEGDLVVVVVVEGIAELRKLCDLLEVEVEEEALSLATVFRVKGKLDRRIGVE
jgi:hypothetical protein